MISFLKKVLKKLKPKSKVQIMAGSYVDQLTSIGDYTYVGYNCFITKATIGTYCSIANNVAIGPGEHDLNLISTNSIFYPDAYAKLTAKDVIIGNDVWIGVNAVIRRGVKIGNGAVVGANSFVNCDIPAYSIYAGTPAKFVRSRFSPEKIELVEKSKWWTLSPAEAQRIFDSIV